jgi:penicillin-insensitive murein endopeptidase
MRGLDAIRRIMGFLALLLAGAAAAEPAAPRFGAALEASAGPPAPHGTHAGGCIAGAVRLPESGPSWQAMRLERNRNWGHPEAIAFVGRLGRAAREIGWPGLYVGDISQPRGGPMSSGHRSHQTGLDIDIWLRRPAPEPLGRARRETLASVSVVRSGGRYVNGAWTAAHRALLRAAASDPAVARIFVNPAIKARLCRTATGERGWLRRVRPWWGHDAHFHVRLRCPADAPGCVDQAPPPPGEGCDGTLAWWFTEEARAPKPSGEPRSPMTLADLPAACRALVRR